MAEWYEDQSFLKGLDAPNTPPPLSGPAEAPAQTQEGQKEWFNDEKFLKGLDQPQVPEQKPSYWEAAKTGFKEGLGGAVRMYETPLRPVAKALGHPWGWTGSETSEMLKPSEEEERRAGETGIGGQIVRGLAGLPGAYAKYGPLMALAPASALGTAVTFGGVKAAEELSQGKMPKPMDVALEGALGYVFRYIEPLGRAARAAILSGTFGTQAFTETFAQTKDPVQSIKAAIPGLVIGGGLGLLGPGKEGETAPPRPERPGSNLPVPYEGRGGFPAPIGRGGPPVDMIYNARTGTYEPRDIYRPEPMEPRQLPPPMGLLGARGEGPRPTEGAWKYDASRIKKGLDPWYFDLGIAPERGEPAMQPDWMREGRVQPPPQYPPVPFEPRTPPFRPPEAAPGPPEAIKPSPPAPTPTPEAKAPEAPVRPPTDKQMATIRDLEEKVGGLSIDLIKRSTGLGTKRANAILEDLVNKGEVVPGGPDSKFPWKFKGAAKPEMDPELSGTIQEMRGIIKIGQPSGVLAEGEGRYGSSEAIEKVIGMKGVSRADAMAAFEKGLRGEEFKTTKKRRDAGLEPKQKEIWDAIVKQAKGLIEDRKAQDEMDRVRDELVKKDPELEKEDLTKHFADEIMVLRKELRENHSDDEINRAIEEATKALTNTVPITDIEAVKSAVKFLLPKPTPKEVIPEVEGLKYLGKDTGIPEGMALAPNHHFNITEEAATKAGVPDAEGATITTTDISPENLKKAMDAKIEEFRKPSLKEFKGDLTVYRAGEEGGERVWEFGVPGDFYGGSEKVASRYGTPKKTSVNIKNPLVVAASEEGKTVPGVANSDLAKVTLPDGAVMPLEKLGEYAISKGHDFIVMTTPEAIQAGTGFDNANIFKIRAPGPKSPTRKGEQLLPGMRVGLEAPKEGAPMGTLEGTPLGEAARKAEIKRVQPELSLATKEKIAALEKNAPAGIKDELIEEVKKRDSLRIGESVVARTDAGEFRGQVAEIDRNGNIRVGLPDGNMVEARPDQVFPAGSRLAVKVGDDVFGAVEEHATLEGGVGLSTIDKIRERYGLDPTQGTVGYEDPANPGAAGFREIPKPEPEPTPSADPLKTYVDGKGVDFDTLTDQQKARWKTQFEKEEKEKGQARTGEAPKEPLSREAVDAFAKERLKILKNAPETEIVDMVDIPERLSNQLNENMQKGIKGIYDPVSKKIFLIRDMMGSEEDVLRTIEHEAVGHYGTEAYLGKEADPFYNRVYLKFGRSGLKDIADERGFDLNTREGRINAAKEKVAQLSETNENPGLLKQLYAWIRAQISKVFPDSKITDAEIQRVISNARKSMISGEFAAREAKISALREQMRRLTGLSPEEPFRPAQFSIGGKAKDVGRAAYEEEVKPVKEGGKKAWEWFVNKISPTTGVLPKNLDLMFRFLGDREMARNRIEMQTEAGVNALNKLSQAEQVDFINKIQMGYTFDELPANLREYARTHRAIEDSLFIKSNAVFAKMDRPSLIAYLENHVRNFWKVVPKGLEDEINRKGFEGLSRRPLEGTRAPLHHQYWTLKEGMANGGVPFTTNLLEITRLNHADTMKLLTAHDMWNAFGDTGLRKFVKFGEAIPEGFRPLEDRIANKYFPPKEAGRWVVEDNVGRLLENFLSRDLVRENPLLKGIMAVKNVTTALELGFSAFHASFETFEAAASQMGLGMRKIWNEGMIREGLKDILTAPKAGYDLFKMGKDWYRLMRNPDEFIKTTAGQKFIKMFPEAQEDIGWLFYGGGTMRMSESYRINSLNAFRENLNSKNYIGAALRSIPALSQVMMRPLFETYIPALKRAQFLREFNFRKIEKAADLLSGKTTKAEMARDVWKSVEDRFGEMNFDNLWWNRTFKSGLQMMVRSVTWKLGNIREYGKGVTGQSAELLSALKEGRMPKLTQEMAWMWGVATLTAAMASVTQYAFTGKSPENWKDLVYPQIDNQGGRLSLPTYARDFFSAIHSPLKYVGSSMAGWFGRFSDIVNNKDFYGVMIHDPGENAIQKRVDDLIHLAPLPFSIQSFKRMREEGQTTSRQLAGFLGATKAPYWIERSDAEQTASDLKAAHLPQGGRTTADFQRGSLIKNYARRYQEASLKGESTAEIVSELHRDINSGKLHMDDLLRFRQRISKEPLVQSVMNLPFKDILSVWNVATVEERKKLAPVLMRKYAGLRSPEDRALYLSKIREIQEEMR